MTDASKVWLRCMGGAFCKHRAGVCTADPEYQAQFVIKPTDEITAEAFIAWARANRDKLPSRPISNDTVTDEREAMKRYLRARMDKCRPLIVARNAFDYRYDETEMILSAIERGEHRKDATQ